MMPMKRPDAPQIPRTASEISARDAYFRAPIACPKCGTVADDSPATPATPITQAPPGVMSVAPRHDFIYAWPAGWSCARATSYDRYLGNVVFVTSSEDMVDMTRDNMPFNQPVPAEHLIHRIDGVVCCIWLPDTRMESLEVGVYDVLARLELPSPATLMRRHYAIAKAEAYAQSSLAASDAPRQIALRILAEEATPWEDISMHRKDAVAEDSLDEILDVLKEGS